VRVVSDDDVPQIGDEAWGFLTSEHPASPSISVARGALPELADEDPLASWHAWDLTDALAGEHTAPVPDVLRRDDDAALLYRGRVNGVHGESGVGKGWFAALAAAQEIRKTQAVVWLDFEDPDPTVLLDRLRVLGCHDDRIRGCLRYHRPTERSSHDAIDLLVNEARGSRAALVVIDSIGEAFALDGIDENKDAEVGPWLRSRARRLADETGAAELLVDHSTKANDNVLHPSGSKRKRAAITGASYLVEEMTALTAEHGGRLRVRCAKDRHGHYRRGAIVAELECTVYPDGGATWHVKPPEERRGERAVERLDRIARAAVRACKEAARPLTQRELLARMDVRGRIEDKRAGIDQAMGLGAISVEQGPNRSRLHTYVHDLGVTS
jgi:hypothetical protein